MILTAKMNQTEQPLGVFSSAADEQKPSGSTGFSSLFSALMEEQVGGEKKPDSLLSSEVSMEGGATSLLLLESTVEQGVVPLPLSNKATFDLETVSSLESQELGRLIVNDPPLSDVPAPLVIKEALPSFKAPEIAPESGDLIMSESLNKIPPPPVSLLETESVYEAGAEEGLAVFNLPHTSEESPSLDLAKSNAKIESLNQTETVEQLLVREDSVALQGQEMTSTAQSSLLASNTPIQGVTQGTSSPQSASIGSNQNVVSWGAQSTENQSSQGFGQQGQSFGQSGQNGSGQSTHQQAMLFSQMSQGDKQQALDQQAAVRAVSETLAKTEGRELLGGAEIASLDRKASLPAGLQTINLPLKHPQWGQALGQRVVFMSNNSLQQAQITLNPQSLGQIQVTLQLDKEQKMHISLVAQNGMTRESMENSLPRLREMMEQAGVQVASVDIHEQKQSFSENESSHAQNDKNRAEHSLTDEGNVKESPLATVGLTDNIVDYYV